MKKIYQLICISLLFASSFEAKAQASLGLDSGFVINWPSHKNQLDTMSFKVRIINYGSAAIDSVEIVSGVMSTGFLNSNSIAVETTFPSISNIVLQPGDTLTATVITTISPNRYPLGIDVVVIWPRANGAFTLDSSWSNPIVILPFSTQVAEVNEADQPKLFPNPFSHTINISNFKNLDKLLLYDLSGNLVFSTQDLNQLDFSNLPAASYFIELLYKNGTRRKLKVIKQNEIK